MIVLKACTLVNVRLRFQARELDLYLKTCYMPNDIDDFSNRRLMMGRYGRLVPFNPCRKLGCNFWTTFKTCRFKTSVINYVVLFVKNSFYELRLISKYIYYEFLK